MPNTIGDKQTFNPSVQKLDASTPAYGPTFDAINQQLVNNDSALQANALAIRQAATPSGVIGLSAITTGMTANQYSFANDTALIAGMIQAMNSNIVTLDTPPTSNVTPSLPGSARDDLVLYEFWRSVLGVQSSRIRVIDGVDFATYPEGINQAALVKAQGGAAMPTTYTFIQSSTDKGVYIAGDGSGTAITALGTIDGYVYAIPLQRVRRKNNAGFNPDSNPLGARDYFAINFTTVDGLSMTVGVTKQVNTTSGNYSSIQVNDLFGDGQYRVKVVSLDGSNKVTVTNLIGAFGTSGTGFGLTSDRPDGLYSNIIDATDIVDLRHHVSLTGFNNQMLLEKSLDLLLRGQLNTVDTPRYGRDYIGLNTSAYTDDSNTLLFCKFNGGIDGTSNGAPVTGTMNTGSAAFVNGIQGQALAASTTQRVDYPVSIAAGTNTYAIEFCFKPNWNWYDGVLHGLINFYSGANNVLSLHKDAGNSLWIVPTNGSSMLNWAYVTPSANLAASLKANTQHKLLISVNSGVLTVVLDNVPLTVTYGTGGTISALALAVDTAEIGYGAQSPAFANAAFDLVRISNIARAETLLPSGFNPLNGDRILDGPNTDFPMWSDDVGGTTGISDRTNPYGLSRVPNQMAARVAYNGAEVRHYFGNGLAAGFGSTGNAVGLAITGSFDVSSERINVNANETANGSLTTFTFTKPSNALGNFTINGLDYATIVVVNGVWVTPTTLVEDNTGKLTATLATPPATSVAVYVTYVVAQRHAHFIPSTKGFVLHDWTDDSLSANGSATTFQTTKYNVTRINHVRTAPAATPNTQTFIASGLAYQGVGCATTLTADAALNATSISVAGANTTFFTGQVLRIAKGDGTWVATAVTGSVTGSGPYTVPVSALPAAVKANATVQGTAQVTFSVAPAAGTVDIVYESVLTPALGDYIRVMYQYTPYQGVLGLNESYTVLFEGGAIVHSLGTGMVNTALTLTICSPNLPTATPDYNLKNDSFIGIARASVTAKKYMESTWDSTGSVYRSRRVGGVIAVSGAASYSTIRGTQLYAMNNSAPNTVGGVTLYAEQISVSIPVMTVWYALVIDASGQLRLMVATKQQTTTTPTTGGFGGDTAAAFDVFRIPGRPLTKGYGGITA